jgi:hypothetical protein
MSLSTKLGTLGIAIPAGATTISVMADGRRVTTTEPDQNMRVDITYYDAAGAVLGTTVNGPATQSAGTATWVHLTNHGGTIPAGAAYVRMTCRVNNTSVAGAQFEFAQLGLFAVDTTTYVSP